MSEPEQPEEYFLKGGGGFEGTKEAAKFSFAGMCDMAASYAEYRVADAESRMENRMKAVPPAAETAMTAEQCARRIDNVICRKDKLEPSEDREEYLAEELEAYAAHVSEAAQGELEKALHHPTCKSQAWKSEDCVCDVVNREGYARMRRMYVELMEERDSRQNH